MNFFTCSKLTDWKNIVYPFVKMWLIQEANNNKNNKEEEEEADIQKHKPLNKYWSVTHKS